MQRLRGIWLIIVVMNLLSLACRKSPEQNLDQFNENFFAKYVPEFPDAQLMSKRDIPSYQQQFFDEANGKLQLVLDLNGNNMPEYVICAFSRTMLQRKEKGAYFLAIFEKTNAGMEKRYLQKLSVSPVTLDLSKNRERGIVISFAFYSDYAAEIYYEGNEYHLEKLF
jgi:hypothetical protein